MPGGPIFAKLFGRSPLAPLQEHMKIANGCASRLPLFFDAVRSRSWDDADEIRAMIVSDENRADEIKREMRLNLPRSLFLPVPRDDLLNILHIQDRIPNRTKDISGLVVARRMVLPVNLHGPFIEFLTRSLETSAIALTAMNELSDLMSSGFSGKEVESFEDLLTRLSESEHASDLTQVAVEQALFAIEKELDPVDVMFTYRLISWVGDLADDAQAVGNRMLSLIAR